MPNFVGSGEFEFSKKNHVFFQDITFDHRFYLVLVIGSLVAAIGLIGNVFLIVLFLLRLNAVYNDKLYLLCIAFMDIFVCVSLLEKHYSLRLPLGAPPLPQ